MLGLDAVCGRSDLAAVQVVFGTHGTCCTYWHSHTQVIGGALAIGLTVFATVHDHAVALAVVVRHGQEGLGHAKVISGRTAVGLVLVGTLHVAQRRSQVAVLVQHSHAKGVLGACCGGVAMVLQCGAFGKRCTDDGLEAIHLGREVHHAVVPLFIGTGTAVAAATHVVTTKGVRIGGDVQCVVRAPHAHDTKVTAQAQHGDVVEEVLFVLGFAGGGIEAVFHLEEGLQAATQIFLALEAQGAVGAGIHLGGGLAQGFFAALKLQTQIHTAIHGHVGLGECGGCRQRGCSRQSADQGVTSKVLHEIQSSHRCFWPQRRQTCTGLHVCLRVEIQFKKRGLFKHSVQSLKRPGVPNQTQPV